VGDVGENRFQGGRVPAYRKERVKEEKCMECSNKKEGKQTK
jgi:hypothetical protein